MSEGLSEQERVMLAAATLSAYKWVTASPARERKFNDTGVRVSSSELADMTGLPLEIVEAAVQNVGEEVEHVG